MHGDFNAPQKCREGDYTFRRMLTHVWVDDSDLAAYFHDAYGMPAIFSEIIDEEAIDGGQTWSWGAPEGPKSELTVPGPEFLGGSVRIVDRVYWFNDTKLGYLDLDQETTDNGGRATYGTMRSPTGYYESTGTETYAGRGEIEFESKLEGTIANFNDFECKEPA